MSRRGHHSRAVITSDEEEEEATHSLDGPDVDPSDPVISSIRYGMKTIMRIAKETIPHCPEDDEEMKQELAEKMEQSLLELVESELTYLQTNSIVNQVCEELNLQENPDLQTKEFLESVDSISHLSDERIAQYKATLSQDVLKSHPVYITMKSELNALLESGDDSPETNLADADTEPDEVDLDDSTMDSHEMIPELDPISKQPLKDPVRNRICKHIYGKASMLQLIKKNSKTRCPAMGCSNNAFIKAADLIEDERLTAKVTGQPLPSPSPKKVQRSKRGRRRR